jgi:hypothetical protein
VVLLRVSVRTKNERILMAKKKVLIAGASGLVGAAAAFPSSG